MLEANTFDEILNNENRLKHSYLSASICEPLSFTVMASDGLDIHSYSDYHMRRV